MRNARPLPSCWFQTLELKRYSIGITFQRRKAISYQLDESSHVTVVCQLYDELHPARVATRPSPIRTWVIRALTPMLLITIDNQRLPFLVSLLSAGEHSPIGKTAGRRGDRRVAAGRARTTSEGADRIRRGLSALQARYPRARIPLSSAFLASW